MRLTTKRRYIAEGKCWICRQPVQEQGQRGPRTAHYACRWLQEESPERRKRRQAGVALQIEHPEAA